VTRGSDSGRLLAPGARIDAYEVVRPLGRGGMGAVYVGRHVDAGVTRAIKVLDELDPDSAARFQREGEVMARLDGHPNVVRVFGAGAHAGRPFLVVELVDGVDLERALAERGPFRPADAARLVELAARGAAHAHAHGVLHRDLKPANVLLDRAGTPKLMDFGLARLRGGERLTATGTLMGSPAYMAPEQADGRGADERTDVYGLGAVLYALLTGRAPFGGRREGILKLLNRVLHEAPTPPSARGALVPKRLEAICLRCLAKAPGERYASAAELADALAAFREGAPPTGRRPGRWLLAAGALAVLVAAATAVGVAGTTEPADPRLDPGPEATAVAPPSPAATAALRDEYLALLDDAPGHHDAAELRERLEDRARRVAEHGPDALAALADAKAARFAARDAAWADLLAGGLEDESKALVPLLANLGTASWATPPAPLGPRARAALERVDLSEAFADASGAADLRRLRRLAAILVRRSYALRRKPDPDRWQPAVYGTLAAFHFAPDLDVLLWVLAVGGPEDAGVSLVFDRARDVLDRAAIERQLRTRPESRALHLLRSRLPASGADGPAAAARAVTEQRRMVGAAHDDLGVEGLRRARLRLSGTLAHHADALPPADRPAAWRQVVGLCRAVRSTEAAVPLAPNLTRETYLLEVPALVHLGRRAEAKAAVDRYRKWLDAARLDEPSDRAVFRAEIRCRHADALLEAGDVDAAAAALGDDRRQVLDRIRRSRPKNRHDVGYAMLAIEVALEQGPVEAARARYEAAIEVHGPLDDLVRYRADVGPR